MRRIIEEEETNDTFTLEFETMTALRTYQERVRKSALRLDKEIPNWERKVSIAGLNMLFTGSNDTGCICGQLGIADGVRQYDKAQGFDAVGIVGAKSGYDVLKRLWIHQIRLRRKADYISRKARKAKVA